VEVSATIVEIHHLTQRALATIVKIGCRQLDIPQAGSLKGSIGSNALTGFWFDIGIYSNELFELFVPKITSQT